MNSTNDVLEIMLSNNWMNETSVWLQIIDYKLLKKILLNFSREYLNRNELILGRSRSGVAE